MAGPRFPTSLPLVFVLALVLAICVESRKDAISDVEHQTGGGRRLFQMASCPVDFSKVDYSSITAACKGPDYPTSACCPPFNALACRYASQVNDFNSLCPIYFLSYLNQAGNYADGVFVGSGRCNNGNNIC